jgi:pantoate--beta-alanine ligase
MEVFNQIKALRSYLKSKRIENFSIGLVPTMGALHAGHLSLIKASRKENDLTVCSIYVNPTQFNNPSDLEKYPRLIEADSRMLKESGCDVLFVPSNDQMYPQPSELKFDFGELDKILEGQFRPGHFSGVGLVVSKLFNIVQPTRAYFGQKDFQQFAIISKLTTELLFDIELISIPIVREPDGLAMSSRNLRLLGEDRKKSTIIYQTLLAAKESLLAGEPWAEIEMNITEKFQTISGIRLEYISLADPTNLKPLKHVTMPSPAIILIAGFVGEVRLIDNILLNE